MGVAPSLEGRLELHTLNWLGYEGGTVMIE